MSSEVLMDAPPVASSCETTPPTIGMPLRPSSVLTVLCDPESSSSYCSSRPAMPFSSTSVAPTTCSPTEPFGYMRLVSSR